MIITHKIGMDLATRNIKPRVDVVQGDKLSRVLEVTLYDSGTAFYVPEGASVMMRYRKPDRTGGSYDTLPDGTQAWSAERNVVRFTLAPQMLTVPGRVEAQMEFILGESSIGTFSILFMVEEDPSAGVMESKDYLNMLSWMNDRLEDMLSDARDSGDFTPVLTMGSVTLLPAGSQPTAEIVGTRNPVLHLGIPDGVIGATESSMYPGCYYRVTENGEQEWLNPPMMYGVEYRTAERSLGSAVYTKRVSVTLPTGQRTHSVEFEECVSNPGILLSCSGHRVVGDVWTALPHITSECCAYFTVSNGTITLSLSTGTFDSEYIADELVVVLKYTKS